MSSSRSSWEGLLLTHSTWCSSCAVPDQALLRMEDLTISAFLTYFWELLSAPASVCPPGEVVGWGGNICRDTSRHTDSPCNRPMLWRDSHRDVQFSSFCSYASGVPRDPAQAGNIEVLWEYFSPPALNKWKPQRTESQGLAKEQCWYLPTLIHDVVILLHQ